jgi:hypothetical protein
LPTKVARPVVKVPFPLVILTVSLTGASGVVFGTILTEMFLPHAVKVGKDPEPPAVAIEDT